MAKKLEGSSEGLSEKMESPPDDRTRLAYERTILARERTLMAWLRTAVSLITFGFTIYKFFELELKAQAPATVHQIIGPRQFAIILIAIGLFALVIATLENIQYRKSLRKVSQKAGYSLSSLVAALVAILGLLAMAAALLKW